MLRNYRKYILWVNNDNINDKEDKEENIMP